MPNYETVYKVFHNAEYGFGGNTTIRVAVTEEDDDKIIGRRFAPMMDEPGDKIVIMKDNVAGWEEDSFQKRSLPQGPQSITYD
jgi:hypothetical protein